MRSRIGATRQFSHIPMEGPVKSRDIGLGGPPGPFAVLGMVVKRITPAKVKRRVVRTFTAPPPTTLVPTSTVDTGPLGRFKAAKWLSGGSLKILRNSEFVTEDLSDERLEEIGGIEYRALRVLGYLVAAVSHFHNVKDVLMLIVSFIVLFLYSVLHVHSFCPVHVESIW